MGQSQWCVFSDNSCNNTCAIPVTPNNICSLVTIRCFVRFLTGWQFSWTFKAGAVVQSSHPLRFWDEFILTLLSQVHKHSIIYDYKKNITGNPHSLHDTSWSLCLMDLDDWTSVLDLSKIFHYLAFRSLPDFYGVCPCRGMAGRRLLFGTRCPKLGTKGSWFPIVVASRADPSPPGWNSCMPAHHPNFITVIPKYCSRAQIS